MITAKGNDAKGNITASELKVKDEYISLKEGQSVNVRVLGVDDYVEYMAHGAYSLDIFTQPCPNPSECSCVYCKAGKAGVEEFGILRAKPRYLFAFANLDNGKIMLLDVSKNQAKKLMTNIDKYAKNIGRVAFTLDRVGSGTDTAYTLNPMLDMEPSMENAFNKLEGTTVDVQFFIDRLSIRIPSEDFKVKMLSQAGFPVEEYKELFGADLVEKALAPADEVTAVDSNPESVI